MNRAGGNDSPSNRSSFGELLAAARAGSDAARNDLFAQVQTYLLFVAGQVRNPGLSPKAGASDIVQQTLGYAAEEFDQFRGDSEQQFRGWLRQILIHKNHELIRRYRSLRRDAAKEQRLQADDSASAVRIEPIDPQRTPFSSVLAKEQADAIARSLEKLPPEMRLVVQLRNWERLQFNEIAIRMGTTTASAAKLWYRALIELERLYGKGKDE